MLRATALLAVVLVAACGSKKSDGHRDEGSAATPSKPPAPSTQDGPAATGECRGSVAVYLGSDGTWLATGTDDKARCFAPRKAGALDHAWLEQQLRALAALNCSALAIEVAAGDAVAYREVVEVMDLAAKVGVDDVGLTSPDKLPVALATADARVAPRTCPAGVIAAGSAATPPDGADDDLPEVDQEAMRQAPVVVITTEVIELRTASGTRQLATIAEAKAASGPLPALTKALPPRSDGTLILQADETTPATVINRVVATARAAGYDNVLFAVKKK